MSFRQAILFAGGGAALMGLFYALWYQFGPEGAKPDHETMRKYRLSTLTEDQLKAIVADARKEHTEALTEERESTKKYWDDFDERYRAWESASARCRSDEIFKMKNEELCNNPPHRAMLMMLGGSDVASEEQYIEWEIMFACNIANTVREARRYRCLPPK